MAGHTATALLLKLGKMAGNLNAGGGGGGRCRRISRAPTGGGVGDTEAMVVLGGFTGAGGKAIAEANGETTDARSHYNAQTCLLRPSNPNPHCPSPCHPAPNPHHKVLAPPLRLALVRSRAYGSRAYTARPALCVARRRQREQWPCGGWGLPPAGPATKQAAARPEYLHDVHILQLELAQQVRILQRIVVGCPTYPTYPHLPALPAYTPTYTRRSYSPLQPRTAPYTLCIPHTPCTHPAHTPHTPRTPPRTPPRTHTTYTP